MTGENPICVIDKATRTINMHDDCKFFGVEHDKRVERIKFECAKEVGDENLDLTKCSVYIAYENAGAEPGLYEVKDIVADGDVVHFSWLFDEDVTLYKGNVTFIIYACKINGGERESAWNTTPAQGVVEQGLKIPARVEKKNASIIESMLVRIADLESRGAATKEQIKQVVAEYVEENPIQGDNQNSCGFATYVHDAERKSIRAFVSFMDDDCRREVYHRKETTPDEPSLWEMIQTFGIPYTLACPPGNIFDPEHPIEGDEKFMAVSELQEMYDNGVGISCHHWRQYNMDEFPTAAAYDDDLKRCMDKFRAWGINDVISISYPQGKIVSEYLPIVKKHFRMGFAVTRDINRIPYASFRMDRCEVFPRGDAYSADPTLALKEAKARVDRLQEEGGWLIFMTHAWYDTFNPADLQELVRYIHEEKGIKIIGVNDAIRATGNVVEVGDITKPLMNMTSPFFIVDSTGVVHANALRTYGMVLPDETEKQLIEAGWEAGYTLSSTTGKLVNNGNTNRRVSVAIPVQPGEIYRLSCSAVYGAAAFAVTTVERASTTDDLKLAYSVPNTEEGEVLINHEIVIPEGGAYLRVSCNTELQPDGWTIYKITYPNS